MEENVYRLLLERVELLEKKHGSLENFVKSTTNLNDEHRLRIEEICDFNNLQVAYEELRELEIADLLDYQNLYGRFDGDYY